MFLSFIVPIYNVAPYLRQCVDSLICQDSDDYEIILVDDGSADNSGEICDRYAEKTDKVKVIHKSNGGQADARNQGMSAAKGEYLAFVDGDDWIAKDILQKLKTVLTNQGNPDLVFMKAYKVFHNKEELLDEEFDEKRIVGKNRNQVLEYLSIVKKYPGSICTKLIKREMLQSNNFLFDSSKLCEDLDSVKKVLFMADSFGCYKEDYYYYRQNRLGSVTNLISFKSYNDRMETFDAWIEESNNTKEESEKIFLMSSASYEYKIMLADYYKLDQKHKEIARRWLKEHLYLLKYKNDKQIKMIRFAVMLLGIENTAKLLRKYINMRDSS